MSPEKGIPPHISQQVEEKKGGTSQSSEMGTKDVTNFTNSKMVTENVTNEVLEFERLDDVLKAQNHGKKVRIKVQIAGSSNPKALPKKIRVIADDLYEENIDLSSEDCFDYLREFLFNSRFKAKIRQQFKVKYGQKKKIDVEESLEKMDYRLLFIRDLPEKTIKRFRVGDVVTAHLVNQQLPETNRVEIEGRVVIGKGNNLTLLIYKIKPLEKSFQEYKISEKDKELFPKYFNKKLDIRPQIAPMMVGREIYQEALLLVLHSLPEIPDIHNGKIIRGCLRLMNFGDTKCCKTEASRELVGTYYNFGDYVVCETGSRTGIVYTIDAERGAIIWGALPLNDLGLVVIDGLDALRSDEMREMREALEQQYIVVRRYVSGEAPCRVRIIGIMNLKKNLEHSYYRCKALVDVENSKFFYEPYNITRWDIFLPFGLKDVSSDLIARAKPKERPVPDDVFIRHVFWVWSRKPEDIIYTEKAKERIIEESSRIMIEYSLPEIPIVHNGFRDVLTRLSVAYACLRHSTDETHEKVIVKEEHVEEAVKFYEKTLEMLQLKEYKFEVEGKRELTDSEFESIVKELEERHYEILELVKLEPKSSTQLAEALGVSTRTIKRDYEVLRKHELITTKTGKGIQLSLKGIRFLKMLKRDEKPKEEYTWESKKQLIFDYVDKNGPLERWKLENFAKEHGISMEELDKIIGEGKREEKIEEYQYDMVIYYRKPRKPPKKGDDKNES